MRRRRVLFFVVVLYAGTWVDGWIAHDKEMDASAQRGWNAAITSLESAERETDARTDLAADLRQNGPRSEVEWRLPMLPGILLADSWSTYGRMYGGGGVKIVLYYGFGSTTLVEIWSWRA